MKRRNGNRSQTSRHLSIENLQPRCLMAADVVAAGLLDFGDAPDSYGTTIESDGARHIVGDPILGKSVDTEPNGQPSGSAKRDGLDEDGVRFLGGFAVVTGKGAVDAWADTNGNGKFDSGEKFIDGAVLASGENYFVAPDAEYYRFRVSEKGGLGPTGFGGHGEVEDYRRFLREPHIPEDPSPPPADPPHNPESPDKPKQPGDADPEDGTPEDKRKRIPVQTGTRQDDNTSDESEAARLATLDQWLDDYANDVDQVLAKETTWLI